MGLLEDATNYYWNWITWFRIYSGIYGPWFAGLFGLFWDNDDGYMTSNLFDLMLSATGGGMTNFPYEYNSVYLN